MRADDLATEIEALGAIAAEQIGYADWEGVKETCDNILEMALRLQDLANELEAS